MRYYQIFTKENHLPEAVKIGFSYPGFFFPWIWAFLRRLWKLGFLALLFTLVLPILIIIASFLPSLLAYSHHGHLEHFGAMASHLTQMPLVIAGELLAAMMVNGMAIYLGYRGNWWLANSLQQQGYHLAASPIAASNAGKAIESWLASPHQEGVLPDRITLWWKATALVVFCSLGVLWDNGGSSILLPHHPMASPVSVRSLTPIQLFHQVRHHPNPQLCAAAISRFRSQARDASPSYESRWGLLEISGQCGVHKNLQRGVHWLRVSATAGDAYGLEQLGMLAAMGKIPGGLPAAKLWLTRGAREGNLNAIEYLGYWPWHLYEHLSYHSPAYLQRLRAGALTGNPVAEYYYAMSFRSGHPQGNLPKTQRQAQTVRWYQRSAAQGFGYAEYELGQCYFIGRGGLPKNMKMADHWWRLAALQSIGLAANNLGYSYQIGAGVPKNPIMASTWFLSSADDGYAPARDKAKKLMRTMTHAQRQQVYQDCTKLDSPLRIIHKMKN